MLLTMLRRFKKKDSSKISALNAMIEQQNRVRKCYQDLDRAEHDFKNASPEYADIAIKQWDMAMARCSLEIQLHKKLERELFHERISK